MRRSFQKRYGGILLGLFLVVFLLVFATVGFAQIEGWSWFDSFYMAVITISTVGFSEVSELSRWGRVFTTFVIISALLLAAYTSAKVGQMILEGELLGIIGKRRMKRELKKLQNHFVICGFGRLGRPVAEGLSESGHKVVVLDMSSELEDELDEAGYLYLHGDATDEDLLLAAGVERARCLLALLPSDADNLYLTITAKGLNADLEVIARATDQKAELKLHRGGADRVVTVYEIAGSRVVQAALRPTVVEFMELATHREHIALGLEEVRVSPESPLTGLSIAKADVRRQYGLIVVAIKRSDGEMVFNPDPEAVIQPGDTLVSIGPHESLIKLAGDCAA